MEKTAALVLLMACTATAQCPPFERVYHSYEARFELEVAADAVRIHMRFRFTGEAAFDWRREADRDQNGAVSLQEARKEVALEGSMLQQYGLHVEIGEEAGRPETMDVRIDRSNVSVESGEWDPVQIDIDFAVGGFAPLKGRKYRMTVTVFKHRHGEWILRCPAMVANGVVLKEIAPFPPATVIHPGFSFRGICEFGLPADSEAPAGESPGQFRWQNLLPLVFSLLYFGGMVLVLGRA